MKRILTSALILGMIWGIGHLYAGNQADLIEFRGSVTKTAGSDWLFHSSHYYPPACWYDTTAEFDQLIDTCHTAWVYIGNGTLSDLVVKHYVSVLDTFGNADSADTIILQFQASIDTAFASTTTWTYDTTAYTAVQTAYVTWIFKDTDSLLNYPGYNYLRFRGIYHCSMDSAYANWTENCVGRDLLSKHLPITVNTAYYPIWK